MNERKILEEFEKTTREDTIVTLISGETKGGRWQVTGGLVGWIKRLWRKANDG